MLMDEVKSGPASLVGRLVDGKYRIEAHLGDGGMGSVYRARHVSLGAARAIKVMRRELAEDAAFVARFQKEARLAARLRHPHLVALYDFAQQADGTWYSVSELVVGETIAARVAKGTRFDGETVARWLGQIADGLALAHREGIVHRDLSPDNIIVTLGEDGAEIVKLLDFGIAKEMSGGGEGTTGAGLLLGKVGYASPEQMGLLPKGDAIDPRTDVFSLTAVAYFMLSGGKLPWPRETPRTYIHDLLVRPEEEIRTAIERDVPAEWRRALEAGLARRRDDRTPTVVALKDAFMDAARPAKTARPTSAAVRAGIVGGAMALGAAAVLLIPLGPQPAPTTSAPSRSVPAPTAEPVSPAPVDAQNPPRTPEAAATKTRAASAPTAAAAAATDAPPTAMPPPESTVAAGAPASLSITADSWMLVSVDGGAAEQTPFRFERLAPGRHLVEARREGYKDIRLEVETRAGETQRLTLAPERATP